MAIPVELIGKRIKGRVYNRNNYSLNTRLSKLKKMRDKICLFYLMFTSLFLIGNSGKCQDAGEIIQKMEDLTRGEESYSEVIMQIVRPRYTREISMKSWALGEDYSLILITGPARDRGIAYLKREKEIWNWLPTIDRLIKLPPSMMSQSWMGSDFTNDDLVRESSTVDDYTHRLIGTEKIEGYECYKIELIPKPDRPIVWSKVIMWIAIEKYFQLKTEQYDERDELVNTISFSDIVKFGDREIPAKMVMVPEDKKGNQTVLIQEKIDFNPSLKETFFSIQNLQRIR